MARLIDTLWAIIEVEKKQGLNGDDDKDERKEKIGENGDGPVDVGNDPSPYQIGGPVIIDDAGEGKELN